MKLAFLAAALIIASSVAFAGTTSVLLDRDKVRSMSAEEYAAAVSSAPDVNVRNKDGLKGPLTGALPTFAPFVATTQSRCSKGRS